MSTTAKGTTWNITVEDEEGESRVIDIQWGETRRRSMRRPM